MNVYKYPSMSPYILVWVTTPFLPHVLQIRYNNLHQNCLSRSYEDVYLMGTFNDFRTLFNSETCHQLIRRVNLRRLPIKELNSTKR